MSIVEFRAVNCEIHIVCRRHVEPRIPAGTLICLEFAANSSKGWWIRWVQSEAPSQPAAIRPLRRVRKERVKKTYDFLWGKAIAKRACSCKKFHRYVRLSEALDTST